MGNNEFGQMSSNQEYQYFLDHIEGGQWGEKVFAKYLESKGFNINEFGNTSDYDIRATKHTTTTYEIKTDTYEIKRSLTPNIFIEFEDFGKPSGISVTKADYYINIFPLQKEMYVIETKQLKKILHPKDISYGNGVSGKGKAYLVNKNLFVRMPLDWELYDDGKLQEWYDWYDMKRKGII